jgi:hypothetical protein
MIAHIMSTPTNLDTIRKLLERQHRPASPSVELIEPEIRTGTSYAVTAAMQPAAIAALDPEARPFEARCPLYVEWSYDVAEEKVGDFQSWLETNEADLAASCPDGVKYLGTYVASFGPGIEERRFKTLWGYQRIAAFDSFAAAARSSGSFSQLLSVLTAFQRRDSNSRPIEAMFHPLARSVRY